MLKDESVHLPSGLLIIIALISMVLLGVVLSDTFPTFSDEESKSVESTNRETRLSSPNNK